MGFLEFGMIVLGACAIGFVVSWGVKYFEGPAIVTKVVWGVVVLIIFVAVFTALGVLGHDIQIPRIR